MFSTTTGPTNPQEMSAVMSEFQRQAFVQQSQTEQGNQNSGYNRNYNHKDNKHNGNMDNDFLSASNGTALPEKSWPQSEFVTNVIEAPIDHMNPGWREKDMASGRSILLRAQAGLEGVNESSIKSSIGPSTTPREGRKIVPSHFTHMKFKASSSN